MWYWKRTMKSYCIISSNNSTIRMSSMYRILCKITATIKRLFQLHLCVYGKYVTIHTYAHTHTHIHTHWRMQLSIIVYVLLNFENTIWWNAQYHIMPENDVYGKCVLTHTCTHSPHNRTHTLTLTHTISLNEKWRKCGYLLWCLGTRRLRKLIGFCPRRITQFHLRPHIFLQICCPRYGAIVCKERAYLKLEKYIERSSRRDI